MTYYTYDVELGKDQKIYQRKSNQKCKYDGLNKLT